MSQVVESGILTVSAFAAQIDHAVRSVGSAVVEGEVQKPQRSRGGLLYFGLTDGDSTLSCKVFGRQIPRLAHEPSDGDLVRVRVERPDFWPAAGRLSLIVAEVELAGAGELLRKRAALLAQLRAEGLCDPDRRKPLPPFPRAIGVIAGKGSDGMSDVIRAIQDRFPPAHIVACPALVQGKAAPRDVIDALATLQGHPQVEAIVIARGGGSVHDLVAFDDERLCRAVFACETPVVAAIGHTDNVPVCNHVTHAAPTPSRSAELVVPSLSDIDAGLGAASQALDGLSDRLEHHLELVGALRTRLKGDELIAKRQHGINELGHRIARSEAAYFAAHEQALAGVRTMLGAMPHRCQTALAGREAGIGKQRQRLEDAPARRLEEATTAMAEHGRLLRDGIARQLSDHEHDYGHAIRRLTDEIAGTVAARPAELREGIAQEARLLRERVGHRLAYTEQSVGRVAALIAARDFRKHGYVLATDEVGKPVSSISDAAVGTRLRLNFRDGEARVSVESTKENEQ